MLLEYFLARGEPTVHRDEANRPDEYSAALKSRDEPVLVSFFSCTRKPGSARTAAGSRISSRRCLMRAISAGVRKWRKLSSSSGTSRRPACGSVGGCSGAGGRPKFISRSGAKSLRENGKAEWLSMIYVLP